jgi:hypothetical protein
MGVAERNDGGTPNESPDELVRRLVPPGANGGATKIGRRLISKCGAGATFGSGKGIKLT